MIEERLTQYAQYFQEYLYELNELLEEMKTYEWSLFSHRTHEMIKLRTEALQGRGSLMGIFLSGNISSPVVCR